jgi:hypothetical protein
MGTTLPPSPMEMPLASWALPNLLNRGEELGEEKHHATAIFELAHTGRTLSNSGGARGRWKRSTTVATHARWAEP